MKNKVLTSFVAVSMLISTFISAIPAFAATADMNMVYDSENSTETSKVINLYYDGINEIGSTSMSIYFDINTITNVKFTFNGTDFDTPNVKSFLTASEPYCKIVVVSGWQEEFTDHFFGTLTVTVPEGTGEFTATIKGTPGEDCCSIFDEAEGDFADLTFNPSSVTIPGAGGGDTKVDFTGSEALTSSRYDAYTNTVPVDAWSTTIDWSAYNAVNKLYWSISNGSETKKVEAKMAEVTGDITAEVTYGLAIAGRADELDTITEVKLVVE